MSSPLKKDPFPTAGAHPVIWSPEFRFGWTFEPKCRVPVRLSLGLLEPGLDPPVAPNRPVSFACALLTTPRPSAPCLHPRELKLRPHDRPFTSGRNSPCPASLGPQTPWGRLHVPSDSGQMRAGPQGGAFSGELGTGGARERAWLHPWPLGPPGGDVLHLCPESTAPCLSFAGCPELGTAPQLWKLRFGEGGDFLRAAFGVLQGSGPWVLQHPGPPGTHSTTGHLLCYLPRGFL